MGVTLFGDQSPINPVSQATGYDTLSTGIASQTAADAALSDNPTAEALRTAALQQSGLGPIIAGGRGGVLRGAPESPLLQPEDANKQFGIKGTLSWDKPVRLSTATLQNQYATERLQREDVLNRAETGFLPATARLAASLGASALDPVNVAASFVPVIGEARFATLAGRIGLTGARIARGAAEGAVGQGLIEPIALQNADAEGRDYDAWNSLSNIAMGAGLGAILHVGGGFMHDRLFGVPEFTPPQNHADALSGAIAALSEDRPVRVAEYLAATDVARRAERGTIDRRAALMSDSAMSGTMPVEGASLQMAAPAPDDLLLSAQAKVSQAAQTLQEAATRIDQIQARSPATIVKGPDLVVARRMDDGSIRYGKPGENHGLLIHEGETADPAEMGFAKPGGDFMTRSEALKYVKSNEKDRVGTASNTYGLEAGKYQSQERAVSGDALRAETDLSSAQLAYARATRSHLDAMDDLRQLQDSAVTDLPDTTRTNFQDAWQGMLRSQRQTHEVQPEQATALAEWRRETVGYDKPIAPAVADGEAETYAAATDEQLQSLRQQGLLAPEHEAALAAEDANIQQAEARGRGFAQAAACVARGLI